MSLFIGIPAYGGKLDAEFVLSLLKLTKLLNENNIKHNVEILGSESLICRARNTIVNKFYSQTEYSHLLFLDADLLFTPAAVIYLLKANKELIGIPYAKKIYNWSKIRKYLKDNENNEGVEKDLMETGLSLFTDANYNLSKKNLEVENSLVRCKDIPTGFMLIRRSVITSLMLNYPERKYTNNIANLEGDNFYDFFGTGVVNDIYLSEDYYFCYLCDKIGIQMWLETGFTMGHIGREIFYTNLAQQLNYFDNDDLNKDKQKLLEKV